MHIVILGGGHVGRYVATVLSKEEHNVTLIDQDVSVLDKVSKESDVATLLGSASDWELLEQLLENSPQFFMAMTGNDETNLAACTIAKNLGYPQTICRIGEISYLNRTRLDFGRLFFVDHFVGGEVMAAHEILKRLISPSDLLFEDFAHGTIQMRTLVIPDKWQYGEKPLKDLKLPEELIVCLIQRKKRDSDNQALEEDEYIFPHGDDHILPCDYITVIGEEKVMMNVHDIFKVDHQKISSAMIVGGSSVAVHLAYILHKLGVGVKVLEKDPMRCSYLADTISHATIINHDGRDLAFLRSEKTEESDAFIATMHEDEENLFVASIGKEAGAKKVVSLISDANLAPVLKKLGISYAISEKVNISNRILSIVHAHSVLSVSSIADDHAHVIEIRVSPDSQLIGIPIKDLATYLPKDLLICVIENKGQVMVGRGNRILSPNDTIILVTSPMHIHEIEHLF